MNHKAKGKIILIENLFKSYKIYEFQRKYITQIYTQKDITIIG